ncbi:metal-dependent transcriptional regulator [Limosilactobacillus sp. STM2_1]|uniref:Manganese transport regulator n=1 Tax=Limosilactobacillus rudii TaxID=2759755 RepID=A0A7W3ULN7_9LACO|nr:metal-dependent transcriptional regulator [Limosilactobacillus rudii]MBB1079676.1 metal-dependent transcriptional regulator [Limosilactobacillus rudii]MBB1097864.1 metal-dependent transcriptional regulator [Limosilactobacillus rudii]MCD7134945.1 metal-dependent transcriptional regulator [Limosilactobacillus rudii]
MTPMKEDYLKIIFELGGSHKKVSNKEISLGLGIAAGSVTEMISKLADEGLVIHEPYAGISLTDKGQKYAAELVRKHRLWETFLVNKLHYNFADVHSEAEILEHQTSDRLATALDTFLHHPDHCPHGGVIPSANGKFPDVTHRLLADADDGEKVELERFLDNHELLTYLEELGLRPQEQVIVIRHEPFEGPIVIRKAGDDKEINVSYKASHNIFIEPDTTSMSKD